MKLNLYRVRFFSYIDWEYNHLEMVGVSEEQIREYVDSKCSSEYRIYPYQSEKADSLTIEFIEEIELPYITHDWND